MIRARRRAGAIALAAAANLLPAGAASVHAQLQSIVFQRDSAPLAAPSIYLTLRRPVVGDAPGAAIVFHSKVRVIGSGGTQGLFTVDPIAPDAEVALRDQAAPKATAYKVFYRADINSSGEVAWNARLSGGGQGVFRSGPIAVSLIGDPAPTLLSGTLKMFDLPVITSAGDVVFHATIFGGPTLPTATGTLDVDQGIFRCVGGDCTPTGAGTLSPMALVGDPVTDRPGRVFCSLVPGVSASAFGIAFRASTKVDCADAGEAELAGVFRESFAAIGAIETLALQTEPSNPSLVPGGTVYDRFRDPPAITATGSVVLRASTGGVTRRESFYLCDPASGCPGALPAEIVVTDGELDGDGNVVSRISVPRISDAGDVSFRARAKGPTARSSGVFAWRSATSTIERIAVKGDAVPDIPPPGALFQRIDRPWISPGGRITFAAKFRGGAARRGIFLFE